jgi:hypothetical protein
MISRTILLRNSLQCGLDEVPAPFEPGARKVMNISSPFMKMSQFQQAPSF